jgi:hypothetical protein
VDDEEDEVYMRDIDGYSVREIVEKREEERQRERE